MQIVEQVGDENKDENQHGQHNSFINKKGLGDTH